MRYLAIPTPHARAFRAGLADANGHSPERHVSRGTGNPCRHCLRDIPDGAEMLVLAYRPFPHPQPYAETGPIFLCATDCARGAAGDLPEILQSSPDYLLKGYGPDHRIVYGTGGIVGANEIQARAAQILSVSGVAYVHVRSARNNCYQLRIEGDDLTLVE